MTHVSRGATGASVLAVGVILLIAGGDAAAGGSRSRRIRPAATVARIDTPLGLQGLAGAGTNVVVPFTLVEPAGLPTDVEAQYAVDRNGDGSVSDDEYFPATEDRLDPRNTRRNRAPQNFGTAGGLGATHAFVWRSYADVLGSRHRTLVHQVTDQGRLLPDPDHPGDFLFDLATAGVRMRIRAVARTRTGRRVRGPWAYTDPFQLDNNSTPSITIDDVLPDTTGDGSAPSVAIYWTGFDADSEDADGDGLFDPGEDANGDGLFGTVQLGVAFDFCRVPPGEDAATMTDARLAELTWQPCTRSPGEGDGDSFRETGPDRVYGTPGGRSWRFVWDAEADVEVDDTGPFLVRGRCIDDWKSTSDFTYWRTPVAR